MAHRVFYRIVLVFLLSFCISCTKCVIPKSTAKIKYNSEGNVISNMIMGIPDSIIKEFFGSRSHDSTSVDSGHVFGKRNFQQGIMYKVYKNIISSFEYIAVYYLALILYVTILGITYFLGMSQITVDKIVPLVAKIGIIALFTNPNVRGSSGLPIGWDYYNALIVDPALRGMESFGVYFVSSLFNIKIADIGNGFAPLTIMMNLFGNGDFWLKALALMFANILMGIPTLIIVLIAMVFYIIVVILALLSYVTTLAMLGFLFAVGPFFFIFLFFNFTKNFFNKWAYNVISLIIQQYAIFIIVGLFGFIIVQAIESMLSFDVKCKDVINMNLGIPLPFFITAVCRFLGFKCDTISFAIPIFKAHAARIPDNSSFMTLFMFAMFIFMLVQIFAVMLKHLMDLSAELVAGTVKTSGMAGAAKNAADLMFDKAGAAGSWTVSKAASPLTSLSNAGAQSVYNKGSQAKDAVKDGISSAYKKIKDKLFGDNNKDGKPVDGKPETKPEKKSLTSDVKDMGSDMNNMFDEKKAQQDATESAAQQKHNERAAKFEERQAKKGSDNLNNVDDSLANMFGDDDGAKTSRKQQSIEAGAAKRAERALNKKNNNQGY